MRVCVCCFDWIELRHCARRSVCIVFNARASVVFEIRRKIDPQISVDNV